MTKDRLTKLEIRQLQQSTGLPYAEVARLKVALDEVLEREPQLTYFGFGIFRDRKKTAEQNREVLSSMIQDQILAHSILTQRARRAQRRRPLDPPARHA
jgi:hypothetical protein